MAEILHSLENSFLDFFGKYNNLCFEMIPLMSIVKIVTKKYLIHLDLIKCYNYFIGNHYFILSNTYLYFEKVDPV